MQSDESAYDCVGISIEISTSKLLNSGELLPVWYGHSVEVSEPAGGEDGVGSPHLS